LLLEFGFKNFYSFKEGIEISFKLDSNCPKSVSKGKNYTNVLCIKGANGSGKTNVLRGLSFLSDFCCNSFNSKPSARIPFESFSRSKKPTEFFVEFVQGDTTYFYETAMTMDSILSERISRRKGDNGKRIEILTRNNNEIHTINELDILEKMKLRDNASVISIANQYGHEHLKDLYDFFDNITCNVTFSGLTERPIDINRLSRHLKKDKKMLNKLTDFITKCDVGISDIKIIKLENDNTSNETFTPVFIHELEGKTFPISELSESSGTKALYRLLPLLFSALENGGLLVIDEFGTHLHPHILPKLIDLFLEAKTNRKGAQLLASTHDAEVLNTLGRYRTVLVNKVKNESFGYRLDQIPGDILRNDRPILPAYNDGKIGGIPKI
jgi:uncharacterized protein